MCMMVFEWYFIRIYNVRKLQMKIKKQKQSVSMISATKCTSELISLLRVKLENNQMSNKPCYETVQSCICMLQLHF